MHRLCLIALCALVPLVRGGDITGHAVITKRLTKKALTPTVYSLRGIALPASADNNTASEFDHVVVMLDGGSSPPKAPVSVIITQQNSRFEPDLVAVPVGSTVEFPNLDSIFHNVFSLSAARSFDLGFYPRGQSRTVKFDRSGVVQVYCHLHSKMYAAIVVTSSPWYSKPAADGTFSWTNVPAGHYHVVAWHKVAGLFRIAVDVPEGGAADVTIRIPVDQESRP